MQVQQSTQATEPRTTSEAIIPAVRGKFYGYSTGFTSERPLGYFMDCKANKHRPLVFAENHADDLDLVFLFDDNGVRACSPHTAPAAQLLGDLVETANIQQTQIAIANMDEDAFYEMRRMKNGRVLASLCGAMFRPTDNGVVTLTPGMIIAVSTETGKYGLLRVKQTTPTSVEVDACHILL